MSDMHRHQIRIDPELRRLRAARRAVLSDVDPEEREDAEASTALSPTYIDSHAVIPGQTEPSASGCDLASEHAPCRQEPAVNLPNAVRVRLRRDGERPLVFFGLMMCSQGLPRPDDHSASHGKLPHRMDLYLASDGRVAVHMVHDAASCPSRPTAFRAGWITEAAELDAIFQEAGLGIEKSGPRISVPFGPEVLGPQIPSQSSVCDDPRTQSTLTSR